MYVSWFVQPEGATSGPRNLPYLHQSCTGRSGPHTLRQRILYQARVLRLTWPGSNRPILAKGILPSNSKPFYLVELYWEVANLEVRKTGARAVYRRLQQTGK